MYKNYLEVKARCEILGGYIPEPKSQLENDNLHSLPIATNFYLGMSDNHMATWLWEKDLTKVTWTNWDSPPYDTAKNCSVMLKSMTGIRSKKWVNFVCGNSSFREEVTQVCEREGKGT